MTQGIEEFSEEEARRNKEFKSINVKINGDQGYTWQYKYNGYSWREKNRGEKMLEKTIMTKEKKGKDLCERLSWNVKQHRWQTSSLNNIIIFKTAKQKVKKSHASTDRKRSCAEITFRLESDFSLATKLRRK